MPLHDAHASTGVTSGWDVSVLVWLGWLAAAYAVGSIRLSARGVTRSRIEPAAFWTGWAVTTLALTPLVDAWSVARISVHMAQHEALMRVGAPLIVVGRPLLRWLWALPASWRRGGAAAVLQRSSVHRLWTIATSPLAACTSHAAAVWIWHVPRLYEAAVANDGIHALQHACFVGTAILFWWGLIHGRYGRAAYGAASLYLFITMVHTGLLGAALSLSVRSYYPGYAARAAALGIDAVADQQAAGLVAWIPSGTILMLCGLGLFLAWIAESDRRARTGAMTPR